jgi:type IV pilus assembly protein PilF
MAQIANSSGEHIKVPIQKLISLLAAAAVAGLLSSCVTTTTGGYMVEASEQQAVQDYIRPAIAYYDSDDLITSRRHLNNALAIDARNADAYNVLALISQREGDLDLAEDAFRTALGHDRSNSRARNNYAVLLFGQERFSEAYDELVRVTGNANYDGRAVAFENQGRSALRLGRIDNASNAFTRALRLNANLHISALEMSLIEFNQENKDREHQLFQQYLTTVQFYSIPYTPRALLAGIRIEGHAQNQEIVDTFALLLTSLYQNSLEFETYQRLSNAH